MNEAVIRDYLADNLGMIEPGLTLVAKEYHLPNAAGARGFVDILARDRFGMTVILEIKRSDKAAREAAHEFFKYVALLRENTGTPKEQLRCLLLSTEWRELIVPFSEFVRSTDYQAEGMKIELDDATGLPRHLRRVEPLPEAPELTLCPRHICFSYETRERRDSATKRLHEVLAGRSVEDYIVIEMEHDRSNLRIVYPFAHYLAISPLRPEARLAFEAGLDPGEREEFHDEMEVDDHSGAGVEDSPENEWLFEELVLRFLLGDFFGSADEVNAASPDTFAALRRNRHLSDVYRAGRWVGTRDVSTDEDIIRRLSGFGGESTHSFHAFTSPKFASAWARAKGDVRYCLEGNDDWSEGVTAFLEEVEKSSPGADVSLRVFNPDSLAVGLYAFLAHGNLHALHSLEIVVAAGRESVRVLTGFIEWDGRSCPPDPAGFIRHAAGDTFNFVLETRYGLSPRPEFLFQLAHGLMFGLAEETLERDKPPVVLRVGTEGGRISRTPFDPDVLGSLSRFINENSGYLQKYKNIIAEVIGEA